MNFLKKVKKILNMNTKSKDLLKFFINIRDEDCLFLHMILPEKNSKENIPKSGKKYNDKDSGFNFNQNKNDSDRRNNNTDFKKKVYYEVGCKIFEINKIYK